MASSFEFAQDFLNVLRPRSSCRKINTCAKAKMKSKGLDRSTTNVKCTRTDAL